MTESEWVVCEHPHWMLKHLRSWKRRRRKMYLYACASLRRGETFSLMLLDPCLPRLLDAAERYTETGIEREQFQGAMRVVRTMVRRGGDEAYTGQCLLDCFRLTHLPGWDVFAEQSGEIERVDYLSAEMVQDRATLRSQGELVLSEEQAIETQREHDAHPRDHVSFLRDIFGNPFCPILINPAWLTPTVLTLAQSAYEERIMPSGELEPARLAVLSDALEEAGCDSSDILAHLRSPAPHVRGCWVLDLLLGKE